MNNYSFSPSEIERIEDLKVRFHHKLDLYYSLPGNNEGRAKVYDEAVELLHQRLYIIMGV